MRLYSALCGSFCLFLVLYWRSEITLPCIEMNIRMKAKFVGYIFQISLYFLLSAVCSGPPWIEMVTKNKEKKIYTKGQLNSEWFFEVIVSPKMPTNLVGILGETMTSYFHSEFKWPLKVFQYYSIILLKCSFESTPF